MSPRGCWSCHSTSFCLPSEQGEEEEKEEEEEEEEEEEKGGKEEEEEEEEEEEQKKEEEGVAAPICIPRLLTTHRYRRRFVFHLDWIMVKCGACFS